VAHGPGGLIVDWSLIRRLQCQHESVAFALGFATTGRSGPGPGLCVSQ
jgi:hypothetical protein